MKAIARCYTWWPGTDREIETLVKSCIVCQSLQKASPRVPMTAWPWLENPWKRIHVDYCGPIQGQMVLIAIDAHSKWIEAIPTGQSSSAATTVSKLRTLFATFGLPEIIVSDNGPAFSGAEFKTFMDNNGITHLTTAPYHPSSNGLAERAVQTVKRGLLKQTRGDFSTKLSRFLLHYRTTPSETTGHSPAELFLKRTLRTRLDHIRPNLRGKIENSQLKMERAYNRNAKSRQVNIGDRVLTKLATDTYWKPATVMDTDGQIVELDFGHGRQVRRHMDQIRPSPGTEEPRSSREDGTETQLEPTCIPPESKNELPGIELGSPGPLEAELALRRSSRDRRPVDRFQAGI